MKKQIILNEDDIVTELAKAYSVNTDCVSIERYTDCEGYGTSEKEVGKINVIINFPTNGQR